VKGNSVSIADGDTTPSSGDDTDFGSTLVTGGMVSRTFTIQNTGTGDLNLTGTPKVVLSGTNAADFSVTVQPSSPVTSGGGTTTFTVIFDPSGTGTRSATLSIGNDDANENPYDFAIQGTGEVNDPPVLAPIGNKSVDEQKLLQFTVTAGDPNDVPANAVTLSATGLPAGATFTPATGVFAWTPGEAQQGQHLVTFTATDDGTPNLADSETVTITVREVNDPPVLATIGNKSVARSQVLTFTATATDADLPANTLTFSVDVSSIALEMTINATTGDFSWTPATLLSPGSYAVTVTVADNGNPVLSDSETLTIIVSVNWQNSQHPCDVTGDGLINPDDVLVLINCINADLFGNLAAVVPSLGDPPPFLDPSGDGSISPIDVLIVINYINTHPSGSAEGEAAGSAGRVALVAGWLAPWADEGVAPVGYSTELTAWAPVPSTASRYSPEQASTPPRLRLPLAIIPPDSGRSDATRVRPSHRLASDQDSGAIDAWLGSPDDIGSDRSDLAVEIAGAWRA
jgi:hypothetical protein